MTDRQYLDGRAREIQAMQNTPGRLEQSADESSFDAWIKYYRQDENSVNSSVSYYDKGAILGLLLDLEIRRRSDNSRSLDDVMRALYTDYFKRGRNYTPEDFQREAERAAGSSLEEFFRRYVRGREELDYNAALGWVGLRLDTSAPVNTNARAAVADSSGYVYPLGATFMQDDERLVVRNVHAGEPAYEQGLNAGDQVVAVDGYRATRDFLVARVGDKKPGDTVTLTVFRDDELRTFPFKLGARASAPFRIVPVASATEQQRRSYQAWLGSPFPAAVTSGVRR